MTGKLATRLSASKAVSTRQTTGENDLASSTFKQPRHTIATARKVKEDIMVDNF
jgi:hypothetical protein